MEYSKLEIGGNSFSECLFCIILPNLLIDVHELLTGMKRYTLSNGQLTAGKVVHGCCRGWIWIC